MARLLLLTNAARRTRMINEACGSSMTPQQVAAQFADEDADLIVAWMEQHA